MEHGITPSYEQLCTDVTDTSWLSTPVIPTNVVNAFKMDWVLQIQSLYL